MIIHTKQNSNFLLKLIEDTDLEDIRNWKNENREHFFYKEIITQEQQKSWFEKHKINKQDFMFIVQEKDAENWINVGCMGYRIENEDDGNNKAPFIDIYNIMRGRSVEGSKNSMAEAFNMMNIYISNTYKLEISCVVLNENPARNWYEKNSLELSDNRSDHILYKLNSANLPSMELVCE